MRKVESSIATLHASARELREAEEASSGVAATAAGTAASPAAATAPSPSDAFLTVEDVKADSPAAKAVRAFGTVGAVS